MYAVSVWYGCKRYPKGLASEAQRRRLILQHDGVSSERQQTQHEMLTDSDACSKLPKSRLQSRYIAEG